MRKDKMYLISEDELASLLKNAKRWEVIADAAASGKLSEYFALEIDGLLNEALEDSPFDTFKAMAYADIACHYGGYSVEVMDFPKTADI